MKKKLKIMSNMPELELGAGPHVDLEHEVMDPNWSFGGIIKEILKAHRHQVVLINATPQRLMMFCLFGLFSPFRKWKLVSLDQNLIEPKTSSERIVAGLKRLLFRNVDLFILHLRDITGYERYYGVSSDRALYIPFKANIWDLVGDPERLSSDGEYVLVAGRSLRDLKTFTEAMSSLKYSTIILHQGTHRMREHGTEIDLDNLPKYIKTVYHDGNQDTWVEFIRKARVVVIPTLPTITAAGVSVYLDAMTLKKCVILSDNPASRGILTDEAIIVPPQDPARLADAIRGAWENQDLRERTANSGREYAKTVRDKKRLLKDVVDSCARMV